MQTENHCQDAMLEARHPHPARRAWAGLALALWTLQVSGPVLGQTPAAPAPAAPAPVAAPAPAAAPAAAAPSELAKAASKLPAGKIQVETAPFPNSEILMGRSLGVVDAPAARVAAILEDYSNYYRFMPHFRASKVLSQRGSSALVYLEAAAAHGAITIWVNMKLKAETLPDQTRVITGKFVKGNVALLHAIWKVAPLDAKRSAVSFEVLLDPDLPLPDSLVNGENEKAARQSMKALREIATKATPAR
jgi:ribosome-associated toxin RatA of RatAB toxin-antitoxin module